MKIFDKIKKRNRKENPSDEEIQMNERNSPITIRENISVSSDSSLELLAEAINEEAGDPTIGSTSDEIDATYNVAYAGLNPSPGRDSIRSICTTYA